MVAGDCASFPCSGPLPTDPRCSVSGSSATCAAPSTSWTRRAAGPPVARQSLWTMDRLPALCTLARLARLPLVSRLVEPGYRLVADHRARFAWLAGSFSPAQSIGTAARKPPAAPLPGADSSCSSVTDPGTRLVDGAAVRAAVAQETLDLADELVT